MVNDVKDNRPKRNTRNRPAEPESIASQTRSKANKPSESSPHQHEFAKFRGRASTGPNSGINPRLNPNPRNRRFIRPNEDPLTSTLLKDDGYKYEDSYCDDLNEPKSDNARSPTQGDETSSEKRKNVRRSTRDIRRPKFDDEIVQSIANLPPKGGAKKPKIDHMEEPVATVAPITGAKKSKVPAPDSPKMSAKQNVEPSPKPDESGAEAASDMPPPKRKRQRTERKKPVSVPVVSYDNPIRQGIVDEHLQKWEVEDDVLLMSSVSHLCDIGAVHSQVKFSKQYLLSDLDERWYMMLYDSNLSQLINKRILDLPVSVVQKVHRLIPFTLEEDKIILTVEKDANPTEEVFEKLLSQNKSVYPVWRSADVLLERWNFLRHGGLLSDRRLEAKTTGQAQMVDEIEQNLDFINLAQKDVPSDFDPAIVPRDIGNAERLYNEKKKAPYEAIAGTTVSPQMANNVLAQLRGCVVSFNIMHPFVVIGRSTASYAVDVNLAFEGPVTRVSRAQAVLKLNDKNDFVIYNIGNNPIYADKHVIKPREKATLVSNTTVEFGVISLLFLRNETARRSKAGPDGEAAESETESTAKVEVVPMPTSPSAASVPLVTMPVAPQNVLRGPAPRPPSTIMGAPPTADGSIVLPSPTTVTPVTGIRQSIPVQAHFVRVAAPSRGPVPSKPRMQPIPRGSSQKMTTAVIRPGSTAVVSHEPLPLASRLQRVAIGQGNGPVITSTTAVTVAVSSAPSKESQPLPPPNSTN